ncbi:ATP-grasp domain-containing protein [Candidatus Nanohalobium constans]|uniref:Succinyl-CoA synthetase beta subunit n=1 Tax=Candidatus Nanohalobium constans TaxID=2565781 RepID=A0A5Q0UIX7_9ARCH|nr:ATP-grasp domain-containing protein [Candidatus Nanohalobium constans]QGA80905.1 succinyl-CoA synthetase beta subunit [Candidatus Nanohalobium constans]
MKLYENEAKEILRDHDLKTPSDGEEFVVKAQVLANHRKEKGGIKFAESREEAEKLKQEMLGTEIDGQEVDEVLIEPQIDFSEEYYVSFMYSTDTRNPVMIFSREGGTGIEGKEAAKLDLEDDSQFRFRQFLKENEFKGKEIVKIAIQLQKLFQAFLEEDARMLEVNPLAKTEDGFVVLDAMMDLEDDASYRHDRDFPERNAEGGEKTEREKRAEKIDEDDHRGVAGKYTELDGDIGMMLAGGGASLTNMDALMEYGGKPANYTEYGGNPPTEKVYKLSKVIMSKELNGLWHVGGTANNTDVERTMDGFIQALREIKPKYPIVVRRDGPHADEAFEKLREVKEELNLNMKLFRNDKPMTESAEDLMEMVEAYKGEMNE